MQKKSIKTITVRGLINFLLAGALIATIILGFGFRSISHTIIKGKALDISEVVIAGLTSHMKAGIMDRRGYFLEEIRSLPDVRRISIIRGAPVIEQFGPGMEEERSVDHVAADAMKKTDPSFILDEFSKTPSIRAVIPYVASSKGSLNCLMCHMVPENTVLGAIDIEVDLAAHRNLALMILLGVSGLSVIFIGLIIVNTFETIERYIRRPLDNLISLTRTAYARQKPIDPNLYDSLEFETVAKEINLFNTEIIANQEELHNLNSQLIELNDEIEETLRETVFTMGIIEERRSKETKNHTLRVTRYCNFLATSMGLSAHQVDLITSASPLHDIGKIGIADSILMKPGKLTNEEYDAIKSHTQIGYAMLAHSKRDILQAAAIIAYQHHERWDGTGYPQGLKGEDIHVYGRIVALADVFDALISARVYKESWTVDEIMDFFRQKKGTHFDPALVDIFLANIEKFMAIYGSNR